MLKITEKQLAQGIEIANQAVCPRAPHCLWEKARYIVQKNCCKVLAFRDIFENSSQAFFDKCCELSDYKKVIYYLFLSELDLLEDSDAIKKAKTDFHDLHVFSQSFIFVFYPLFLANNKEIPLLSSEEIINKRKEFSQIPFTKTEKTAERNMVLINYDWFGCLQTGYLASFADPEKYKRAIIFLFELFLMGFEKNQAPNLLGSSSQEKEAFFHEIRNKLF